jgi:hypothetical protein
VVFNESEVLRAFRPVGIASAVPGQTIQAFYNDEHALTMGAKRVVVKTSAGTVGTNYTLTANSVPACINSPAVGSQILTGDQAGTDLASRPLWPALFITDITGNPSACAPADTGTCCDWQALNTPYGATCDLTESALPPDSACGVWKGAVRTVDKTRNPIKTTVTPDADPAKNNYNLGAGADPVPSGLVNQGYGAETRWDIDALKTAGVLQSGHTYRLQFMVHDGDQNKSGGDVGEACVNVAIP